MCTIDLGVKILAMIAGLTKVEDMHLTDVFEMEVFSRNGSREDVPTTSRVYVRYLLSLWGGEIHNTK